jgi:hypothetical protein
MTENRPQKVPLIFFRSRKGTEPVREWPKELPETERHRRQRPLEGAMAVASWNASVSADGGRALGNPHQFAVEPHCACTVVSVPRAFGRATRLHQENANDPRRGFDVGAQAPGGANEVSKRNMGSSIDDFLKAEGIFEQTQSQAVKEVVAWQLAQAMKEKKISKNRMATMLKTSRTQVDRLLDAKNDITLSSLERAATMVGRRVTIQLV